MKVALLLAAVSLVSRVPLPPGAARSLTVQDPAPQPAPSPTPAPTSTPTAVPVEEKPTPPAHDPLDATVRFDLATYEAALGRIAAAYPDLLRVRSLGKSRGGRDVWLAVAADDAGGDAGRRPAAVVITDLAPLAREGSTDPAAPTSVGARVAGPEAGIFALASVLARAREDPKVRERLQRCALYFLPAPDPDSAFPATDADAVPGPRRSRLDRNFPSGWEPYDADAKAPGPYPLCEPESQLLARFLLERVNVSMVVSLGGATARAPEGEKTSSDQAAAGSLESYCREVLEATVLRPTPWIGAHRTTPIGTAPEGFFTTAALVEKILGDLPRLECGAPKVERLRPDVWLVDLPLANAGNLPTVGRGARTSGAGGIQLRASGGRVVACAVDTGDLGTYDAVRGARGSWPLGSLEGSAKVAVRLVVQGDEGGTLEAVFESPRSGRSHVSVALR